MQYKLTNHLRNPFRDASASFEFADLLSLEACQQAYQEIKSWPGYAKTPLIQIDDIAQSAGVQKIFYKDESGRFGLGSFKALGGSYAINFLADEYTKQHGSLKGFAVATATDGNHGRSVAWGAKRVGVECHIYIHAHVSQSRSDAMTELGAKVHRIEGNYDDSLVACEEAASENGWQIVSDTSWEGYETVPVHIMAGYSVMASEIIEQLNGEIPTHFFIPAGCGGLAGGMLAYLWQVWKDQLPKVIIVESEYSACVYQTIENDAVELLNITQETVMAGLSCGEVSRIVWPLLRKGVSDVVTIPDDGVIPMMKWLANPNEADTTVRRSIEGGECSAASLIALLGSTNDPATAQALQLDENSKVLVLGTEGATDPEFYQHAMQA